MHSTSLEHPAREPGQRDRAADPADFLAAFCTVAPDIRPTLLPQSSGREEGMLSPEAGVPLHLPAWLCQQPPACSGASATVGFPWLPAPCDGSMRLQPRWDLLVCREPPLGKRRWRLPQVGKKKKKKIKEERSSWFHWRGCSAAMSPSAQTQCLGAPQSHLALGGVGGWVFVFFFKKSSIWFDCKEM